MKRFLQFITVLGTVLMLCTPSYAVGGLSIIRDTEIENMLQDWANPILKQAGLSPSQVRLILVNSDEVNAFVAGGSNIFIYAGLIQKAEYPEELIGVMAHETGHITGGHLIATRQAMERASYQSILATILGVGAAIASGDSGAFSAVSLGGQGAAMRGFLSHSRTQESAADQAGLRYMVDAGVNPQGSVSFLEKLEGQELLPVSQQSEYMRTHPLTRDRLDVVRNGVQRSGLAKPLGISDRQHDFDMMKAKLLSFRTPHMVTRYYNAASGNEADIYAFAIMKYQQKRFDEAISFVDQLLSMNGKNPYYHELKAQIYRDQGDLKKAEQSYRKTLSLMKGHKGLIQASLAHVLIEQGQNSQEVEKILLSALKDEKRDTRIYRLLATVKGRRGQESAAQYYLAEEAVLQGRRREARRLIALAMKDKSLAPSLRTKAQDLKIYLDGLPDKD